MELIPSSGASLASVFKGTLGLFILVVIAIAASSNRKAIPWKTVLFGLLTQLIIGICILKVPFIQAIFEQIGTVFIKVIEYTLAGSTFMFGDFVDLSKTAYIFAFQVLPVFFCHDLNTLLLGNYSKSSGFSSLGITKSSSD